MSFIQNTKKLFGNLESDFYSDTKERDFEHYYSTYLLPRLREEFPTVKCLVLNSSVDYDDNFYEGEIRVTCFDEYFGENDKAQEFVSWILDAINLKLWSLHKPEYYSLYEGENHYFDNEQWIFPISNYKEILF